jgi:hypothetical protein
VISLVLSGLDEYQAAQKREEILTALRDVPPWGRQTKTHKQIRKAPIRRGKRREGAFVVGDESEPVVSRWSFDYDACIDCGATDRPHRANGRCKRCDDRWRYRSRDS